MVTLSAIRDLARMARLAATRGIIRHVASLAGRQTLQVEGLAGEVIDACEHWQPYGLTAHPPAGAEAVMLSLGGNRSHAVAVVAEHRDHRPRGLDEGESCVYDAAGQQVYLSWDGVRITSPEAVTITVGTQQIEITSDGITIRAPGGLCRIEALAIELAATTRCKIDVAGRGYTYLPDSQVNWTQGTSSSTVPPAPPEHAP